MSIGFQVLPGKLIDFLDAPVPFIVSFFALEAHLFEC
jgi:hypothetical protein